MEKGLGTVVGAGTEREKVVDTVMGAGPERGKGD